MSEENVAAVRRAWEAWIRGDLDAAFAETSPDFEWDLRHFPGWPDGQIFKGRDAVTGFFQRWRDSWDEYEAGVDDYVDVGENRVLVLGWQSGRGRGSGAATEMEWAQIYTVRDGRLLRCENYADREEALRAVGMRE
jgi:hypothetical protein